MTADSQLGLVVSSNAQDDITDTELEITTPVAADPVSSAAATLVQYIQPPALYQPASSNVALPPAAPTLELQASPDPPTATPCVAPACAIPPAALPSPTALAAGLIAPSPQAPLLNNGTLAMPHIRYGSPPPAKRRKCGGRHMRAWAGMPNIVYHQGANGTQGYWGPEGMYPYDNMLMHYGDKGQFTTYGTMFINDTVVNGLHPYLFMGNGTILDGQRHGGAQQVFVAAAAAHAVVAAVRAAVAAATVATVATAAVATAAAAIAATAAAIAAAASPAAAAAIRAIAIHATAAASPAAASTRGEGGGEGGEGGGEGGEGEGGEGEGGGEGGDGDGGHEGEGGGGGEGDGGGEQGDGGGEQGCGGNEGGNCCQGNECPNEN
ncbi:hypothetical protein GGF44_004374, partial [Coemansia sp. RSA 1694]